MKIMKTWRQIAIKQCIQLQLKNAPVRLKGLEMLKGQ